MTSPVQTLDISELDQAAPRMIKYGFRHFPITVAESSGKKRIVGVISMRDLFRNLVVHQEALQEQKTNSHIFALITEDDAFSQLIGKVFSLSTPHKVEKVHVNDMYTHKFNALILDLDSFLTKNEESPWPKRLRELQKLSKIKFVIISFDPSKHPPLLIELLKTLEKSKKFIIFKKPVEVSELYFRLQTLK